MIEDRQADAINPKTAEIEITITVANEKNVEAIHQEIPTNLGAKAGKKITPLHEKNKTRTQSNDIYGW